MNGKKRLRSPVGKVQSVNDEHRQFVTNDENAVAG